MIPLDAHIRTIIVLTGGKLTGFYFLHLLSVTTHQRQGKKVSYHAVGIAVRHAMSHNRVPGASRDPRMSCSHFCKT
jgi:hypothetical protein